MKRVTPLLIVLAMVAAACGGDGDSAATTAAETTVPGDSAVTTAAETTVAGDPAATTTAETTAATPAPFGLEPGTVTAGVMLIDGVVREYLVAVPPGYSPDVPAPLIFDLHGRGGTASGQAMTSEITIPAWNRGFVVVHPQAAGDPATWSVWPDGPDLQAELTFFRTMIKALSSDLAIDSDRVFVTGFSNGGGMAGRLACEMADEIAGIASAGASNEGWAECEPSRPVPVLAFHGLEDDVILFDGGQALLPALPEWAAWWADANGCETDVSSIEIPTGLYWHWGACDGAATVSLLALNGVGHEWPTEVEAVFNSDDELVWLGAAQLIVEFFASL